MAAVVGEAPMAGAESAELATAAALVDAIYEQSMQYWNQDPAQNRLEQAGIVRTKLEELEDHPLTEFGYELQVKYEGAQHVGAYKVRGATAAILAAQDRGEKFTRAVTASAGNLGGGLQFAATRAELKPTLILAAETISPYKKDKMVKAGARVDTRYPTLEAALAAAEERSKTSHNLLVHPFNSVDTMSGQASVGHELVEDLLQQRYEGKIDLHRDNITIVVPGGGGGLGAATAAVFAKCRERGLMGKNVRVVVAQMAGCNQIARLRNGRTPLTAETLDVSCDGTAVLEPGKLAMKILMDPEYVSEVVSVPKPVLAKTMRYLSGLHGAYVEPAGALSMAAAMSMAEQQGHAPRDNRRHVFITVTSGINISPQAFADFHPDTMSPAEREAAKTPQKTRSKPASRPSPAPAANAATTTTRQKPADAQRKTGRTSGSQTPSSACPSRETGKQAPPAKRKTAQAAGSTAAGQVVKVNTPRPSTQQQKETKADTKTEELPKTGTNAEQHRQRLRRKTAPAAGSVAADTTLKSLLEQVATYQESVWRATARKAQQQETTTLNSSRPPEPKSKVVHRLQIGHSPTGEYSMYNRGLNHPVSNRNKPQ